MPLDLNGAEATAAKPEFVEVVEIELEQELTLRRLRYENQM
jgi:hypothetical protein